MSTATKGHAWIVLWQDRRGRWKPDTEMRETRKQALADLRRYSALSGPCDSPGCVVRVEWEVPK